jgi:23S rRNA U2552 (ribose-2'-O)-methylase RlmE/FtsJ
MNIEITKKVNIQDNDGLSSFKNHAAQQHHDAFGVFYDFLKEIKPARILEIGTALGGFTQFLQIALNDLNNPAKILSYDIHRMTWYTELEKNGIDVRVENVFGDNYSSVNQEVIDFIQGDGITIVLCDGGNKIGEFNILSKYIKNGDFILAHDYIDNSDNFNSNFKNKIWNWHEISDNDINQACLDNNLKSYNKEKFDNVVWVCKFKSNE